MAFDEVAGLFCCLCECCLWVSEAGTGSARAERRAAANKPHRPTRGEREAERGVRLSFERRRITDVEFLDGELRGRRASQMNDMELKRLALSMPHPTARFALRRFLRHRKRGRIPPAAPAVRR